MNLRLRLGIEWLVIGLVSSFLVFLAYEWEGTQSFDHVLYDQLGSISRPVADDDILLVNIDDPSLAAIGKWPWPRDIHAQLVSRLQDAAPRSITLDVILSENGNAENDEALAQAMRGNSPVMMPLHFVSPGSDDRNYDIVPPALAFENAASATGHVNLNFDKDGVVRRAELCFDPEGDGESWPHLMEQVYRADPSAPSPAYVRRACGDTLLIPYAKRGSHNEISYSDIINSNVPSDLIKGRDVIIGASAAGMGDSYPVPYGDGGILAGSEIMANMLRAIKQDSFITPAAKTPVILISLLPVWILMIGFLRWSPRTALIASLSLVAVILVASATALSWQYWFPPGSALLGILLIYPLWGWRRLQAMSDFMKTELMNLEKEGETLPIRVRQADAADLVGRQSTALSSAIDHMRDLRQFVSDTLSDLPDPTIVTDLNGRITLTNDLVKKRLGETLIGQSLSDIIDGILSAEYREIAHTYLTAHYEIRELDERPERENRLFRFQTRDNRTFVMRHSVIKSGQGKLQGHIYYLADITALATAEEERERVLQLLSHDMRAPQSAIIASLEGRLNDEARARIERNARRTMQLAQDFVDMARMGESEFAGQDVLLVDLIRDVADNYWPLANERDVRIEIDDKSGDGFVSAEPDGLTRAFANLIDNAIKFSPNGGTIEIGIDCIQKDEKPYLRVEISDSGQGIDPEIAPNLFQRFATGGEQSGRVKGTGLGLTYVQAVIERHNGSISAMNRERKGACFQIILPESLEDTE